MTHTDHKRALRARMRAVRDEFARDTGGAIPVPPPFRDRLAPGLVVASYRPVGGEADPAPLEQAALSAGCRIALPHVTSRAAPIRFLAINPAAELVPGPFGLANPASDAPEVAPDIVLVPLVAFDAAGHRLGQGAGHYDRALAALPHAWRLGVAWSVQQVDLLAADTWDVPLHAIATEQGLVTL
jgi:5-formyltetrahydrofolate cyclo-ligase